MDGKHPGSAPTPNEPPPPQEEEQASNNLFHICRQYLNIFKPHRYIAEKIIEVGFQETSISCRMKAPPAPPRRRRAAEDEMPDDVLWLLIYLVFVLPAEPSLLLLFPNA